METGYGAIIKIEPNDLGDAGGIKLKGYMPDRSKLTTSSRVRSTTPAQRQAVAKDCPDQASGCLSERQAPAVCGCPYKTLTEKQKHRIHILWQEQRKADPEMPNAGQYFVRIMVYVAKNVK